MWYGGFIQILTKEVVSNIIRFNYEDQQISFEFADGNKMINATEMAKPFPNKRINNFLRNQQTIDFISLLESRYANSRIGSKMLEREVLRVVKGGKPDLQGTWMDEKLALKFAAWLSPEFELWVFDRIEELLINGKTQLKNIQPGEFGKTLRLLAEQWEQQEKINMSVRQDLNRTAKRLDELESKIISSDENYYTIAGYCNLVRVSCPLHKAKSWGKSATALSRKKTIPTGLAHDERYGKVRTYHKDVLREIIG